MPKFTPPKQRGLNLAVFLLIFVFNYTNCYSDVIVPKLNSTTTNGWVFNNVTVGADFWSMNKPGASVETAQFYNFEAFTSITIKSTIGTYVDFTYCTTRLEISNDGVNWTELALNTHQGSNTTGKTFSFSTSSLPNKRAKIRLIETNTSNSAGARLFSIEITGTQPFIPAPISNEAKEITTRSFTANWNSCNNATDYEINIYNKLPGKTEKAILNEDFSEQVKLNELVDTELSTYLPNWNGKYITFLTSATENQKFIQVGKASTKGGYIETPPLNLSGNNGKFELSFDIGTINTSKCSAYLYINNEKVAVITINATNLSASQHQTYSFDKGTENCKIKLEGVTDTRYAFIMDNLLITQTLDGVETSIAGYPKSTENNTSHTVEGLAPSTTYYYTVKATNGVITTNKSDEIRAKTLAGDYIIINSNEERVFNNETINGNLRINDGAKVSGMVTVTGEISYVCRFTPGKWHSFSLPFIPRNVGGYIDGKGCSLRENIDYTIKNYQNEKFTDAAIDGKGYIIKVKSNIDNGELFFFSDKGFTLNKNNSPYTVDYGYTHLGNPYTYNISPKELVAADKYYSLINNKFIECEDELLPFQSFIAFKATAQAQPKQAIHPDTETGYISPLKTGNIKIWQNGKYLWIIGAKEPINIYSAQGKLIYAGSIESNEPITLPTGIYLVKTTDLTTKIIIK